MARKRKMDEHDDLILNFLRSKGDKTIEDVHHELNKSGKYLMPTVRYRLTKLVDMNQLVRLGKCGWGQSYKYHFITSDEVIENLERVDELEKRTERSNALRESLAMIHIKCGPDIIDEDNYMKVDADSLRDHFKIGE